jgi:4-hydroxy-tetrahydrodipicolinate synthase
MNLRYNIGEVVTAMVTPFDKNLEVDFAAAQNLAKHLVANGSDAVLIAGTTGESPTLTHEEEFKLLEAVKSAVGSSAKIMMGTGSNSTKTAVTTSKKAQELGADAILSVVPYYNKPNQRGLIEHFGEIAKAVDLPIMLYNIPGRTVINMEPETVAHLAREHKNIFALKQSSPDMDAVSELKSLCPDDFALYSGDDSLTLPMLSLGAHGVVSVAAHIVGNEIKSLIQNFKKGDTKAAQALHLKLFPIFRKLFMAPNPIPLKAALADMGLVQNYVRRPLTELTEAECAQLLEVLKKAFESLK